MGGTTGIGIVLSRVFPSMDVSLFVLILNVLLLLLGWAVLGRKFALTTVASSFLYPLFLFWIQKIPGVSNLTENALVAAIFAGALLGISLGVVMRVGSSTGGMDIVNLVLHKWTHLPLALLVYLGDIVVVGGQAIFSDSEKILLGIIVLVLESLILDRTMILGKSQIQLFIVSGEYEKIREVLLDRLQAGVTLALIETGLLEERQKGVICVIPQRKLYDATRLVHETDPEAFITVTQIKEVRGRGFTMQRRDLEKKTLEIPLDGTEKIGYNGDRT
jgi:uncharacterized membrane-anchored protein YitT (DUF2179 family)